MPFDPVPGDQSPQAKLESAHTGANTGARRSGLLDAGTCRRTDVLASSCSLSRSCRRARKRRTRTAVAEMASRPAVSAVEYCRTSRSRITERSPGAAARWHLPGGAACAAARTAAPGYQHEKPNEQQECPAVRLLAHRGREAYPRASAAACQWTDSPQSGVATIGTN